MNYQEAFFKIVNQYGIQILNNSFLVYSILCDYVRYSLNNARMLGAFYILNIKSPIYSDIKGISLKESKELIKRRINKIDKKYTFVEYVKSIEPLLILIFKNEYIPIKSNASNKEKNMQLNKTINSKTINKSVIAKDKQPTNIKEVKNMDILSFTIGKTIGDVFVIIGSQTNKLSIDLDKRHSFNLANAIKVEKGKTSVFIDNSTIGKYKGPCIIQLPKHQYKRIKINYLGKKRIKINSLPICETIVDEMSIKSLGSAVFISGNYKKLHVTQKEGRVLVEGMTKYLTIYGIRTDVNCVLNPKTLNKSYVNLTKGNIRISFYGAKPYPKINKLFKTIQKVDGVYKVCDNNIDFRLATINGKIIVG